MKWHDVPVYPKGHIDMYEDHDKLYVNYLTRIPVQDVQGNWWLALLHKKMDCKGFKKNACWDVARFIDNCHQEALMLMHNAKVDPNVKTTNDEFVFRLSADQSMRPFKLPDKSPMLKPSMKKADPGVTTQTDLREEGGSC